MSPSEASSGGPYERPFRDPPDGSNQSPPSPSDSELMRQVLEETMAATDRGEAMDPKELEALLGVARRHAGRAFAMDPIAIDLVAAVLESRFGQQIADDELRRSMAVRIAETLVEASPARERLESLWNHLNEAAG